MLVVRWWTSDRLLEKRSYGWAYTGYFVHTNGRICVRMVGCSNRVVVWLVTDCCSCVGPVKKMVVWLVITCLFCSYRWSYKKNYWEEVRLVVLMVQKLACRKLAVQMVSSVYDQCATNYLRAVMLDGLE